MDTPTPPNVDTGEHLCPRRAEAPFQTPGPDRWMPTGGPAGQDELGHSCSYCGSLHPDQFMQLVRDGWIVGPTDKNYKIYLNRPLDDTERAARKTAWSGGPIARAVRESTINVGKSAAAADAAVEEHWLTREEPFLDNGKQVGKVYLQHLSRPQQDEFIELHNSGAMKIGYPGRLYATPFFARPASPADTEGVDA